MRSPSFSQLFARRAVPAVAGIIAVSFIVMAGVLVQIGTRLDERSAQRSGAFLEAALAAQKETLERLVKDYASWAEAYQNLHPRVNSEWAFDNGNVGLSLYTEFGANFVLVVGPDNRLNYAVVDGRLVEEPSSVTAPAGLMGLVARARASGLDTVAINDVLASDGIPVLGAAAVLSPFQNASLTPTPGPTSVLVLGYTLTPEKLAAVGERFFVPQLRLAAKTDAANGTMFRSLVTEDGTPTAPLAWNPERPGSALLRSILPWLGSAATLLALLTYVVLRDAVRNARLIDRSARQLAAAHAKAEHLAMHDVVTGLPNRAMLRSHLDAALKSRGNNCVAVLYLDLDRFKPINDLLGHHAGDEVLIEVAKRLKSVVRDGDLVARVGGDEFVLAMIAPCPTAAGALARRIMELAAQPILVDRHEVQIGVSIGIATAPDDTDSADELIQRADIAMYQAKNDRRGSYQFFSREMNETVMARRALEIDLRRAVAAEEFVLHFQPRFDTASFRIVSVEALLRWQHPERGLIPPSEFIPLAEETGLITQLGNWALREACRTVAAYDELGVSVNLSPAQFRSGALVANVVEALAESGLPAHRLELELTEGVLLENTDAALEVLNALKALGVALAMDDFGTGYSSLGYLQSFPFDRLKIDQTFVSRLTANGESRSIVQAILGLGRALGLSVTAEGVESAEQLLLLRADHCAEVQGFLLARPMPVQALDKIIHASPEEIRRTIAA